MTNRDALIKGDVPIYFFSVSRPPFFLCSPFKVKNKILCFCHIPLQDINLSDRSYSLNPFHQSPQDDLLESIHNLGILHPPLLLKKTDNSFIILSGRKRIESYIQYVESTHLQSNQQKPDEVTLPALVFSSNGEKG
ncbi:MAG: hypothetical protein D3908_07225, partial [Candidatus Electrothrix sp. AUS4]|nr:hypothetical protein [Candidatus Electrothrix sp. AUS4]